jgi:hypothetical protein
MHESWFRGCGEIALQKQGFGYCVSGFGLSEVDPADSEHETRN